MIESGVKDPRTGMRPLDAIVQSLKLLLVCRAACGLDYYCAENEIEENRDRFGDQGKM